MSQELTRNGTGGRVYGGDPELVHIEDGRRAAAGVAVAAFIDTVMRQEAAARGAPADGTLCPGCYMIAVFNAAVVLAQRNGQPLRELCASMAGAFRALAQQPQLGLTEEIIVMLDVDLSGGDR